MDRTERLLDLVALFLDAREPVSWAALRRAFPEDYDSGAIESAERKFERDKAELLELGVPLEYIPEEDGSGGGYRVDRAAYYLPEPDLEPDELAMLYAAGSAALASGAFPGRSDLAWALRKIGLFTDGEQRPLPVRMDFGGAQSGPQLAAHLEQLRAAGMARKWVELDYASPRGRTFRRVDPYGLALRRGIWSLVGFCHLRHGIRTFHVHRIQSLKTNPQRPRSPDFELPEDLRIEDYVAAHPWQHRFHPAMAVWLRLEGPCAALADRLFPGATVERAGEAAEVLVQASFLDGLLRYVLSLSPDVRVLGPERAKARLSELSEKVRHAHASRERGAA